VGNRVLLQFEFNAEGVGKFQPRVCFETPADMMRVLFCRNSEGVATALGYRAHFPRVAKAQPWAEIGERFQR
jgi:hypothetical protein